MENLEFNKSLEAIIEKRRNCIPLTNEEEKLVNESLNKLLDAKKCVNKIVTNITGEALRKSVADPILPKAPSTDKATEGLPPQDRGKAGGYESKADVAERQPAQATDAQPVAPVKLDVNLTDKKEETVPTEKPAAQPYGDKTTEEWADADEKKHTQENYEEDRVGRMTEHANYPDSIKTHDIVVKTLTNGSKLVGQVLKVYNTKNGQIGLMVKWSDGRFEHVNQTNVELLKAIKNNEVKTEKGLEALIPIATEAAGVGLGIMAGDVGASAVNNFLNKPKKPKTPKIPTVSDPNSAGNIQLDAASTDDTEKVTGALTPEDATKATNEVNALPSEAPEEFIRGVIDTLKELTDLNEEEIINVAKSAWKEIAAEEVSKACTKEKVMETGNIKKPEDVNKDTFDEAVTVASPMGQSDYVRAYGTKKASTETETK